MKYRRYAEYKHSGVEWLGEVPAHWEVKRLKHLADIQTGVAKGRDLSGQDTINIPYLRVANVQDGYLDLTDVASIEIGRSELDRYRLQPGDVLMNEGGDNDKLGRGHVWRGEIDPCIHQNHVFAVRPHAIDADWLTIVTGSEYAKFYFFSFAKQSTNLASISSSNLRELPIICPPPTERNAICEFLNHETAQIDALVAKQERLIAVLQEKRQALISHAVTKGLNPDAPMKDSGVEWLGEVPAHWEVKRLKHIAGIQTGVAKGRDLSGQETIHVPYMRVANVQDGYLDLDDVASIEIARSELDRYRLQPGDVLMNEGGDNDKLGRGSIWWGEIDPCIHQNHVFAVRPHGVEPEWLTLVTSSDYAKFYFYSVAKQSTNLASISSSNLREVPILCPPAAERTEIRTDIAARSAKYDQLLKRADLAVYALKERRTTLISAAVTGKIDVASSSDGHDN